MSDSTDEEKFLENLDNFLSGNSTRKSTELSIGGDGSAAISAFMADLDKLNEPETTPAVSPKFFFDEYIADDTCERLVDEEPAYTSPYDKLIRERHALEVELESAEPDLIPRLKLQIATIKKKIALEGKRGTDDEYRERNRVNQWRAEHQEEYNAGRRKRVEPNLSLSGLSDQERQDRLNIQKVSSKAKRSATMTEVQKLAARAKDRARKAAKKAIAGGTDFK